MAKNYNNTSQHVTNKGKFKSGKKKEKDNWKERERERKRHDCGQNNIVKKNSCCCKQHCTGIKTRGWSIFRGTGIFEVWIGFKRLGFIEFVWSSYLFSHGPLCGTVMQAWQEYLIVGRSQSMMRMGGAHTHTAITPVQNNLIHICTVYNTYSLIWMCLRGVYSTIWSEWRSLLVLFLYWLCCRCYCYYVHPMKSKSHAGHKRPSLSHTCTSHQPPFLS